MSYVGKEQIQKAKEVDLISYLKAYEPDELVHISGENYCTKTHDSLKISNGKWNWFSRGIGGKTALDYLIKVKGYKFVEAVKLLTNEKSADIPKSEPSVYVPPKNFSLPKKNDSNVLLKKYLSSRGIHQVIVDYCLEKGIIYESENYHNVVFVGFDETHKPRYVSVRSTITTYKGDVKGSNKRYGFCIMENPQSKSIHVFESAIDLLSYTTLKLLSGDNWRSENYLSLAGVFQSSNKIPPALEQYLSINKQVENIVLHLDNDKAGRDATRAIIDKLMDDYTIIDEPPQNGKDINEQLKIMLKIQQKQEYDR